MRLGELVPAHGAARAFARCQRSHPRLQFAGAAAPDDDADLHTLRCFRGCQLAGSGYCCALTPLLAMDTLDDLVSLNAKFCVTQLGTRFGRVDAVSPVSIVLPHTSEQLVGSGDAWILAGGKVVKGHWSKPNPDAPIGYTGPNGEAIRLVPGRTWVELANVGAPAAVR